MSISNSGGEKVIHEWDSPDNTGEILAITFCASAHVRILSLGFLSRYAGWKVGMSGMPL
jgi:hypothetical protein